MRGWQMTVNTKQRLHSPIKHESLLTFHRPHPLTFFKKIAAELWISSKNGSLFIIFLKTSNCFYLTLKSTSVSVCFRGISRLPSAFVFLWWFKLAHISIQVCTFHDECKQGIDEIKLDIYNTQLAKPTTNGLAGQKCARRTSRPSLFSRAIRTNAEASASGQNRISKKQDVQKLTQNHMLPPELPPSTTTHFCRASGCSDRQLVVC